MSSRQMLGMIALTLIACLVMHPNFVSARSDIAPLGLTLTAGEEAARLWGLANADVARKLYPSVVETFIQSRSMPYIQQNFRQEWFDGPLDDRKNRKGYLAEKIGEQGRARYAAEQGWLKFIGSKNRGIRQGPDAVYFDPRSRRLLALESKGGTSQLRWSPKFDSRQGTNQYTLRSAKRVLISNWKSATPKMKLQMARVILATEMGQIDTVVIKTEHVLGRPTPPPSWSVRIPPT